MATIIQAPAMAANSRQLRRPGAAAAAAQADVALAPVAPVASAVTVSPEVRQDALARQERQLRDQAELLREREQALDAATSRVAQRETELRQLEQQLAARQQQLDDGSAAAYTEAERRGEQQGRQRGEQEARDAVAAQVGRLNALVQTLQQARRKLLDENEDMLVEIAFTAICRMLGSQAVRREAMLSMISSLLEGAHAQDKLTVRLHAQDAALLAQDSDGLDARLSLQADTGIELGGCLLDSVHGTLDARLEIQLQHLRETLLLARRQRDELEAPI
ncbi:hypothetical protein GJ699_29790 [Duganella sp. FT80W]|uniref:Flagellar assembly protein FliH n=1 Tax=Duganella guangzhouensis TaxID=2666084 RepID=A0A6I2L8I7_9BURK|nr:FliH/SctL family protein [Duganella guangzhouensis]MRW94173.1 hypothetical protein [Duganella guangzhouensis]